MKNNEKAKKQHDAQMRKDSAPAAPKIAPVSRDKVKSGGTSQMADPKTQRTSGNVVSFMKKLAKINSLPKTVTDSIPFRGIMPNGVIETYDGTFTKSYRLQDVSFSLATDSEQLSIFNSYTDFLNTFNEKVRWQFTIFNHEIDKKKTISDIRICPQRDGLNPYRQELNGVLLNSLKQGNNSIKQEKFLTVSVDDINAEHAVTVLRKMDAQISRKLRKICKTDTYPLSTQERLATLYSIYNQDSDYRFATGVFNNTDVFDLEYIEKCGLSVKDVIGPSSFDWGNGDTFKMGDTYAYGMFLEKVPSQLSTNFLEELSDIQCNMLISVTHNRINSEEAVKLVKNKLSSIEASATAVTKRNNDDGLYAELPPELARKKESARDLLNDITARDQNLFDITFLVVVFARTAEQLDENVKLVKEVVGKYLCSAKPLKFQQEFLLNTALPLCRDDCFVSRLYTTESAGIFIPYSSQEINQKNAIFYGLNQTTKSMILYDRTTGDNFNGLIFGHSGSGKSMIAKIEMTSVLLGKPDTQIFVIDPQGEYFPLTKAFRGQEIELRPGSHVYINPLDLDISEDSDAEVDPVTMKVDFVMSMFEIILGKTRELDPVHTGIIDKSVRKIYQPYLYELNARGLTYDPTICPTLSDLYQELMLQKNEKFEAGQIAELIYRYAVGSFDTFSHRTNVETNARFVVYNTKNLGSGMRELGLHICTSDIWNRMISNSKKNIYTWFYIDEFHVLLESDKTTEFLRKIWKMARKWLGVPTGIMQNTEDLLRTADTRAIVNNTNMIIILREPLMDRQNLAELLSLSSSQLQYITNSDRGHGLIYNGKVAVPFAYDFPENTGLYKLFSTSHDVEGAKFA